MFAIVSVNSTRIGDELVIVAISMMKRHNIQRSADVNLTFTVLPLSPIHNHTGLSHGRRVVRYVHTRDVQPCHQS